MERRLDFIDGLRGLAICGVVLIHVGQIFTTLPNALSRFAAYGVRGVELFFIVSAFTLTRNVVGKPFLPGAFYTKRFLRIAPMFYLAIIWYLFLNGTGPQRFAPGGIHLLDIALTFTFLHGLTPASINSIVPGGWSIADEALFYAILPLLLRTITTFRQSAIAVLAALMAAIASSFVIRWALSWYPYKDLVNDFISFGFLTNLPSFLCGIMIYHILQSPVLYRLSDFAKNIALLLIGFMLVAVAVCNINAVRNPIVAPLILSPLVIMVAVSGTKLIDNRFMRHLGTVSFSLYLIHFTVLRFLPTHRIAGMASPSVSYCLLYVLVLLISAGFATVTYRYIEEPAIKFAKRLAKARLTKREATPI